MEEVNQATDLNGVPVHCKKCRHVLFRTANFNVVDCHHKSKFKNNSERNCSETNTDELDCETLLNDNKSLFLTDEPYPLFIAEAIENFNWQKEKLHCPKCKTRIGSFNFVNTSCCSCSQVVLPPIHLHSSKIDFIIPRPVLTPSTSATKLEDNCEMNSLPQTSSQNDDCLSVESAISLHSSRLEVNSSSSESTLLPSSLSSTNDVPLSVFTSHPHQLPDHRTSLSQENSPSSVRKRDLRRKRVCASIPSPSNSDDANSQPSELDSETESSIPDQMICPVCLDLLFSPFEVKPCSHIFCEPCLRRLAKRSPTHTSCPLCRELIGVCHPCKELNKEIRDKFSKQTKERHKFENIHNTQHLPLPWIKHYRFFGYRDGVIRGIYGRNWTGLRTIGWIFVLDCLGMAIVLFLKWLFDDSDEKRGEIQGKQRALDSSQSSLELEGSYSLSSYMDSRDLLSAINQTVFSSLTE